MSRTTIRSVTVEPLNIPLLEPFTIATGTTTEARNVLITITLEDGSVGYGESTPFSPSTGETQETALAAARGCAELLKSKDAAHWRILSKLLRGVFFSQMTAIAGIEMALLDALTHSYGIPLYVFFGGAATSVETDISIPMVTPEHAYDLAKAIVARGITTIKIKVGGDIREDVARVQAVREAAPRIGLMLDANQGYTASEALLCLEALDDHGIRPLLMEQPVHKDDYEGLRYVTQHTPVPVAADESAYSAANVAHLIAMGAINVVNIKLMKSGFVEALDIAAVCRATHTQLINGGTQHVTYMLDVPIMAGRIPGSVNSWKGGNVDVPGFPPGYRSRLYTNESSYLPNIVRPLSPFWVSCVVTHPLPPRIHERVTSPAAML